MTDVSYEDICISMNKLGIRAVNNACVLIKYIFSKNLSVHFAPVCQSRSLSLCVHMSMSREANGIERLKCKHTHTHTHIRIEKIYKYSSY